MCVQRFFVEIQRRHRRTGGLAQKARQLAAHIVRRWRAEGLVERAAVIRSRHVIAALRLGQAADQCRRLVGHKSGRQPRQARRIKRIEQMQRHLERHAIVDGPRLEAVLQRQPRIAQREILREPVRLAAFAGQQIVQRPMQAAALVGRQGLPPRIQATGRMQFGRNAIQIPARLPVLVGHDAGAAQLGFLFARLFQHLEVIGDKRRTRVDFARHQALPHEQVVRGGGVDLAEVHRLLGRQHQAEQTDLLGGHHLPLCTRPVRVEMLACQQVRQLGNGPVRLDRRIGHAPHFLGVEQGRRKNPRWRLACQRGARKRHEPALPRSQEIAFFSAVANLRRQARQQCAVQGLVGGSTFALGSAHRRVGGIGR